MVKSNQKLSDELDDHLDQMEYLKADSQYLRGTIEQGLANPITGAISQDDACL